MIWILLRTFIAWGSARLLKKKILKTDFDKPVAIILAIIWGLIWGIAAAVAFEYIFGAGTFSNRSLVPSILFTSIASYYALITKDFTGSKIEDNKPAIEPNEVEAVEQPILETKKTKVSFFRKLILVKSVTRALISVGVIILLFTLILATETISIKKQWSIAHQNFMNTTTNDQISFCQSILDRSKKNTVENCDKFLNADTSNIELLVEGMKEFNNCENSNKAIYAQNGCLVGSPGTLISYSWNSLKKSNFIIPLCLFVGILVFIILLAGRVLILEEKLGWKRLSIVLGCIIAFIIAIIITLLADDFHSKDELFISILISLILTPFITIILVLKGRSLFEWVNEGFSK
jgi:hypothetical protein